QAPRPHVEVAAAPTDAGPPATGDPHPPQDGLRRARRRVAAHRAAPPPGRHRPLIPRLKPRLLQPGRRPRHHRRPPHPPPRPHPAPLGPTDARALVPRIRRRASELTRLLARPLTSTDRPVPAP